MSQHTIWTFDYDTWASYYMLTPLQLEADVANINLQTIADAFHTCCKLRWRRYGTIQVVGDDTQDLPAIKAIAISINIRVQADVK